MLPSAVANPAPPKPSTKRLILLLSHLPSFWRGLKTKFGHFPQLLDYEALSTRFPSGCIRVQQQINICFSPSQRTTLPKLRKSATQSGGAYGSLTARTLTL